MHIAAISDLHGNLDFNIEPCDLLLIAGDICPATYSSYTSIEIQARWLIIKFKEWLEKQPIKECVAISGNHDWIWEVAKNRVPFISNKFHYLQDNEIILFGKKIYGSPWQPPFNDWAFNMPEERLEIIWSNIPEDTDILLTHAPPYGIMDQTSRGNKIGSVSLLEKIKEIQPSLCVFGHNHKDYGTEKKEDMKNTVFVNCSLLDEQYDMVRKPIMIEV